MNDLMRAILGGFLFASIAATPVARADQRDDAEVARMHGDFVTALRLLLPLADQGDAKAQSILGSMYYLGQGVAEDRVEAANWYRRAAEQGDAGGQRALGRAYDLGDGVPQDYAEAAKWIRKAAEQGEPKDQSNIAYMYESGHGVPQDFADAARWYRKAAEQGDAPAQSALGQLYATGHGVAQDYVEAHMWLNLAQALLSGSPHDDAIKIRNTVEAQMTPAQIAEAQKRAREWKPK